MQTNNRTQYYAKSSQTKKSGSIPKLIIIQITVEVT